MDNKVGATVLALYEHSSAAILAMLVVGHVWAQHH
jgi:hypothetical protein